MEINNLKNRAVFTLALAVLSLLQLPPITTTALAQTTVRERIAFKSAATTTDNSQISTENSVVTEDATKNIEAADNTTDKTKKLVTVKNTASAVYSATAYCLSGRTASGAGVRRGIIAADPRVLPLGTRVQLTAGNWSGTYTVADTGGAIKGRKIDVWVPSNSEARKFGRRSVSITVLGRK